MKKYSATVTLISMSFSYKNPYIHYTLIQIYIFFIKKIIRPFIEEFILFEKSGESEPEPDPKKS